MTVGIIDAGTNTVLLLVAKFDSRGALKIIRDELRIVRLGEGMDAKTNAAKNAGKIISPAALERLNATLYDLKQTALDTDDAERIVAVGTSAFRRAENATEILRAMKDENGIEIEILSGDEEARRTVCRLPAAPAPVCSTSAGGAWKSRWAITPASSSVTVSRRGACA